jgi:Xaa-Pro aminopeptidase
MSISSRISRLAALDGADHILILRTEDIRWLTGFTGGTAQLLVHRGDCRATLFVDGRYVERAHAEIERSGAPVDVHLISSGQNIDEAIATRVQKAKVAIDLQHITAFRCQILKDRIAVVAQSTSLDLLRRVKDEAEIALMARAAAIADHALQSVVADGIYGRTEKQVRNQLDALMRENGADDVGFDTIVATGPNGARPHHEPSDTVIECGHGVVIDFGAELEGYRSDMTRTIRVGEWSAEYQHLYETVIEAQAAGVHAVTAGVVGSAVDAAVRSIFAREGLEHEYVHGTGHGIGLYIHEEPILSPRCTEVLQANEVVTVEPGLYRGGVGGVRIEDQVVVTGTECRILTLSPKELSCPRSPRTI